MPSDNIKLREALAAVQHEIWAHWMSYQLSLCSTQFTLITDDTTEDKIMEAIIPPDKLKRWKRQMETPYSELSEKEKDSDREQADKVLAILRLLGEAPHGKSKP